MLDDVLLEVGCIQCKSLNLKIWWKIHGNSCPTCNPEFRGSLGLDFPPLPLNWRDFLS